MGAGGLSNAIPELINGLNQGGKFELRDIPTLDNSMSPLEIWCNESQERYVLAIYKDSVTLFTEICKRENCPLAILGHTTDKKQLVLHDSECQTTPINIPLTILFGNPPRVLKDVQGINISIPNTFNHKNINIDAALYKVIAHPTVASKAFLINIGDRSVGGNTIRDQMVGKWQIPVANCAITSNSFCEQSGEIMAIGERAPIAILNAAASGRMAVAESITNISSGRINKLNDIKLSANWMASAGSINQDALLYHTVQAVSELCCALNIAIPVGKDSLSMNMRWQEPLPDNKPMIKEVISPVSVVISAFATMNDVALHITPELIKHEQSSLILIGLTDQTRIGASVLQECYNKIGGITPDIDSPLLLHNLFICLQQIHSYILAYHDRSDGGLIVTLCEMIFASRLGVTLKLNVNDAIGFLFNEEIGVVVQIADDNIPNVLALADKYNLYAKLIGTVNINQDNLIIYNQDKLILNEDRGKLQSSWSYVSYSIQKLRDNPVCAESEFKLISTKNNGLFAKITFDVPQAPNVNVCLTKPKVAILREQGVNGHLEMAYSFTQAGFVAIDVHLNDLLSNKFNLNDFIGLAVCGGFSYGDVFRGWSWGCLFYTI